MKKRKLLIWCLIVLIAAVWAVNLSSVISTPHVAYLNWLPPLKTAFMSRDSNDTIRYKWVPLKNISIYLRQAVILAEDDQFMSHEGIDTDALKKAAKIDWRRKKFARGGSTITMQLARNLYLSPQKSLLRKYREILIALRLERELPKDRILELYLNVAEWGNGIYGAEAAAQHYFGKGARFLNKHEASFLAAILPRPRYYDRHRSGPFLSKQIEVIKSRL